MIRLLLALLLLAPAGASRRIPLRGEVVNAATGKPIPSRVYVRGSDGAWHIVKSAGEGGTAVPYRKQSGTNKASVEFHATLSAHPFEIDLPAGEYTVTAERGKEYLPVTETVKIGAEPVSLTLKLRRWIDMASRGWYSGDTHVHRTLEDLPNIMLAEDLNVAFPLTSWVTEAYTPPGNKNKGQTLKNVEPKPIAVDPTHVIYPINTEYEIFTVNGKRHTLGALFLLNQKTVPTVGVPPIRPPVEKARQEGAILELDKHNWPWSMMLVPLLNVDLYEITNNHIWRTEFGFKEFGDREPAWMKIERDEKGYTEWGWIDYGFQNYYALLNCGFRMRPTAGTASGVHPVPLGFGRVYVSLPSFDYAAWLDGLNRGRSFVTTGPMLFADIQAGRVRGTAESGTSIDRIEIVVSGEVVKTLPGGTGAVPIDATVPFEAPGWIAVRCFEKHGNRVRFAHSAPVHFDVAGQTLRPRKQEVEFLIGRVEAELKRHAGVLTEAAVDEYREALRIYQSKLADAR